MLIRIKQSRKQNAPGGGFRYGTDVDLTPKGSAAKRIYKFQPLDPKTPEVDHVCDVTDKEDVARLLAIPEGFEIHDSVMAAKPARAAASGVAEAAQDTTTPTAPNPGNGAGTGTAEDKRTQKELLAAVHAKTGKKPSPATSRKKLLELLAA